jgi:hypothetical protein
MLLPRFTIRTLLAILTVCAVAFVMVGTAYRGQYWAWGVTIGLISLIVAALSHAAWFGIVWLFARLLPAPPDLARAATPLAAGPQHSISGSAAAHAERSVAETSPAP